METFSYFTIYLFFLIYSRCSLPSQVAVMTIQLEVMWAAAWDLWVLEVFQEAFQLTIKIPTGKWENTAAPSFRTSLALLPNKVIDYLPIHQWQLAAVEALMLLLQRTLLIDSNHIEKVLKKSSQCLESTWKVSVLSAKFIFDLIWAKSKLYSSQKFQWFFFVNFKQCGDVKFRHFQALLAMNNRGCVYVNF